MYTVTFRAMALCLSHITRMPHAVNLQQHDPASTFPAVMNLMPDYSYLAVSSFCRSC